MEPIRLALHHNSTSTNVKFFRTTSTEAFEAHVRKLFGLPSDAPLRFLDEDGDVVLVDLAGMPPGMSLHVAAEQGVPITDAITTIDPLSVAADDSSAAVPIEEDFFSTIEEVRGAEEWCVWERHDNGTVTDDGMTFAVQQTDKSGFTAYTKPLPTSGRHYFAINFPCYRVCCIALGLVSADIASVPHDHLAREPKFPFLLPLVSVGMGPAECTNSCGAGTGAPPMTIGVLVDLDARFMVLTDHNAPTDKTRATRLNNIPPHSRFVLTAPKHDIRATLLRVVPTGAVYCGASAVADKVRMLKEEEERSKQEAREGEADRQAAGGEQASR